MITLIAALDRHRAIGRDGDIPWHMPSDLQTFQRETLGGAVIMGRRTWESLPRKPLPNRLNIVVTSGQAIDADVHTVTSVEDALELAMQQRYARIYGIGGAGIYQALLPRAQRMVLTHVDAVMEGVDTFFPSWNDAEWKHHSLFHLQDGELHGDVREWIRKT